MLDYNDANSEFGRKIDDSEQKMKFVHTTNRKFGTITIVRGHFNGDNQMLKIFQRHGKNVAKLILVGGRIENLVGFVDILNLTPNLNHAVIRMVDLRSVSDVILDQDLPVLRKLNNLEIIVGDQRIITCFRKATLKTIKVVEDWSWRRCDGMEDFLSSQEMLTSLSVRVESESSSILAAMGKWKVPILFRLTNLNISDMCGQRSLHDQASILRFVKSQAETIEELGIGSNIPNAVYECVFAKMSKLNCLSVAISDIPKDNDFYKRLKENCSVRRVKLRGDSMSDIGFILNFFNKLPNIRRLILPDVGIDENHKVLIMAQYLTQLESLSIRCIDRRSNGYVTFPNLKTLHIEYLCAKINWNEFTKIHPRLVELAIRHMYIDSVLTSDDIDHITTSVGTQTVRPDGRFGVHFKADDRFLTE